MPGPVDIRVRVGGTGLRGPPHRGRRLVLQRMLDRQPDQRTPDQGELAFHGPSGGPTGQPRVPPVPRLCDDLAVVRRRRTSGDLRFGPRLRLAKRNSGPRLADRPCTSTTAWRYRTENAPGRLCSPARRTTTPPTTMTVCSTDSASAHHSVLSETMAPHRSHSSGLPRPRHRWPAGCPSGAPPVCRSRLEGGAQGRARAGQGLGAGLSGHVVRARLCVWVTVWTVWWRPSPSCRRSGRIL